MSCTLMYPNAARLLLSYEIAKVANLRNAISICLD